MTRPSLRAASVLALVCPLVAFAAQPSVSRGASVYQARCALCHSVEPGAGGGQGPNLRGVVGRKAASSDFSYSAALRQWGRTWTPELLGKYLTDPTHFVPGTTMVQKVTDRGELADLVAYLASLQPVNPAPAPAPGPRPHAGVSAQPQVATAPLGAAAAGTGAVLTGAAAFGDWRSDAPGVRRLIRVEDLPAPFATSSARN